MYSAIKNSNINYPTSFDYTTCLAFLQKLSQIFQWKVYERDTLGKGDKIKYYTVILTQWMEGNGLHEIIRKTLNYYKLNNRTLISYEPQYHTEVYNGSTKHNNQIINETMKDIEQIVNYKLSMYFLRFSEAIIKIKGEKALINDWYEYVEYGTNNNIVIALQKHGFMREQALALLKPPFSQYVTYENEELKISKRIMNVATDELNESLRNVQINYPEIYTI